MVFAVVTMDRPGTSTWVTGVQRGSALPGAQLLPGAADTAVAVSVSLVTGLSTRTGEVIVTVPPTGMSPVQTVPVAPIDKVPELAVMFPSLVALADSSVVSVLTLIPKYGVCPALVSVAV